jgi:hypothetical protein
VLFSLQKLPYGFVAALTGVMAFPISASAAEPATGSAVVANPAETTSASPAEQAAPVSTAPADNTDVNDGDQDVSNEEASAEETQGADDDGQADTCMVKTICSIKQKIRWMTPAWTPPECQRIANAVAASSKRHDLSPTLLLAIMINESDMNEKAFRLTLRGGKVYAKDGGLMAIRCVLNHRDHCVNGNVRGMAWKDIMDPVTNIEVGARELAYWRDGGGVASRTINRRDNQGHIQQITKDGPCHHLTHAWWAHYNHGPRYIDKGYARHYPHRIAVLDHALATVMNLDAPELNRRITIHDPGRRERTIDRPLEKRFKKLYEEILSSGSCSALAYAN